MGDTHYWQQPRVLDAGLFAKVVADFQKVLPHLGVSGVVLAGPEGTGEPIIGPEEIWFNGRQDCGHPKDHTLEIPWPSANAGGVRSEAQAKDGIWPGGSTIVTRTCDGDCSYETFGISRVLEPSSWNKVEHGLYGDFCKTAFRPYDLAGTVCLLILKHHFGDQVRVMSDGQTPHWFDAMMLCQQVLDYGLGYRIDEQGELVNREGG